MEPFSATFFVAKTGLRHSTHCFRLFLAAFDIIANFLNIVKIINSLFVYDGANVIMIYINTVL
jgi:hypothetical protein